MPDGLRDRRYSEMSRQEIDILMNDRWALLCVFTVSAWRLLAVTCCYCCCWCSAVIFSLTGQSGAAWQDCYCVAERWVKGEERFKDPRLFQRGTGTSITAHDLIHIRYLQPLKGGLCGGEWKHAHFRMQDYLKWSPIWASLTGDVGT